MRWGEWFCCGNSMRVFRNTIFVCCLFTWTVLLFSCLGRTVVRNIYYISPKKKTVFFAPPVNYTSKYLLDDRIRSQLEEYFSAHTRFAVVKNVDDSDLYVLLYIHEYQMKEVGDYGFGNTEVKIKTKLFVSDSRYGYKRPKDKEQIGRYYFKDYSLETEVIDYVYESDNQLTQERMEESAIKKLSASIHELMLTGKLPSR